MADTIFIDGQTVIQASWLNQINDHVHNDTPISPSTSVHAASVIEVTPTGNVSSTNVQSAIAELDTEKQPIDATLTALAGVTTAADKLIYATGSDTFATTDITSFARTLLDDIDAAEAVATLGIPLTTRTTLTLTGTNSVTLNNIPSTVTEIKLIFANVTASIDWSTMITIGTGGVLSSTGYVCTSNFVYTGLPLSYSETAFSLPDIESDTILFGTINLSKCSGNTWVASGVLEAIPAGTLTPGTITIAGSKTLTGALNDIKIARTVIPGNWVSGTVTITYQ